ATLCLLNAERARRGLRTLRVHRELQRASQRYARDMVTRRFFSHVSPSGAGLLQRTRSTSRYLRRAHGYVLGENLAWGTGTAATPRQIVAGWMRSPGHRRNVLDRRFREVGLGIAAGVAGTAAGAGATYASQFGLRR
ncbi:MAG: CAP domain-containing protein, partial [Actinomycetota bacterium]|nr:CAP domain-containing protein [Actinomycetota bacterium]